MKDDGFKNIIFNKDRTLSKQDDIYFHNRYIRLSFMKACEVFGKENICILSNDNGLKY